MMETDTMNDETKDDTMTKGKFTIPSAEMINKDMASLIERMEDTYEAPASLQIKTGKTITKYAHLIKDLKQTARDNANNACIELSEDWPSYYHIDTDRLELHIQNMDRIIYMRTNTYTGPESRN